MALKEAIYNLKNTLKYLERFNNDNSTISSGNNRINDN